MGGSVKTWRLVGVVPGRGGGEGPVSERGSLEEAVWLQGRVRVTVAGLRLLRVGWGLAGRTCQAKLRTLDFSPNTLGHH